MAPDDLDSMNEDTGDLPDPGIDPVADRKEARRLYRGAQALHRTGDLNEALWGYGQAIRRDPSLAAAYSQLGDIRFERGHFKAAEAALRRAIAIDPGNALAHTRLGEALRRQGRTRDAAITQLRALQIAPDDPRGHLNLSRALRDMGLAREAVDSLDRALRRGADWDEVDQRHVRWERAQTVLMTGDLAGGFTQMDGQWEVHDLVHRGYAAPLWDGSDLTGGSLIVHVGLRMGDVIMFARFLPLLARRGCRILVECHAPLLRLLSSIEGVEQVIPRGDVIPQTDFRIPLMALPHLMGVDYDRLGEMVPYISPERRQRHDLPKLSGVHLRVGITWGGRDLHRSDSDRLLMLERFLTLMRVPGVALYSFQRHEHAGDLEAVGASELVHDVAPMINDMADNAALLHDIDLLIGVDTAVAHLAGAMGRPVWLMLPHAPDWRWQMGRDDSPWYPTFQLFRQAAPGEWDELFDRVGEALRPMVPAGAAGALAAAAATLGRTRGMDNETARPRRIAAPAAIDMAKLEQQADGLDLSEASDGAPQAGNGADRGDDRLAAATAFKAHIPTDAENDAEPDADGPTAERIGTELADTPGSAPEEESGVLALDADQLAAGEASFDNLPVVETEEGEVEFASLDDNNVVADDYEILDPEQLIAGRVAFGEDDRPALADAEGSAESSLSLDADQIEAATAMFEHQPPATYSTSTAPAGGQAAGDSVSDFTERDPKDENEADEPDPAVDGVPALTLDADQIAAASDMFEVKPTLDVAGQNIGDSDAFAELELDDEDEEDGTDAYPVEDDAPTLTLDADQIAAAEIGFGNLALDTTATDGGQAGTVGESDFAELELLDEDPEPEPNGAVDDEPDLDLDADQMADTIGAMRTTTSEPKANTADQVTDAVPGLILDADQLAAAENTFGSDAPARGAPCFTELDLPTEDDAGGGDIVDDEPALDLPSVEDIDVSATAEVTTEDGDGTLTLDDDTMAAFSEAISRAERVADDQDEGKDDDADNPIGVQPIAAAQPTKAAIAPAEEDPNDPEAMLPSVLVDERGQVRFHMSIRASDMADPDIQELCRQEPEFGGYFYAARRFLDDHLMPGDLFIDYGAHWGVFTLTAATRWPGDVAVLAIEPSAENVTRLQGWLGDNYYDETVETVCRALGAGDGTVQFDGGDGSMRYVLLPDGGMAFGALFEAPVTTLDALLAARPQLQGRRTFLRLAANGHEHAVLEGAQGLLGSGDLAAILISRGRVHDAEPVRGTLLHSLDALSDAGFHHYRFPHELLGGVMIPYVYNHELCTVFSLATDFQRWQSYDRPAGGYLPASRPSSVTLPPAARAQWAELLMRHQGTDGGRWAHPDNLESGAEDRATLIARHLTPDSRVLDVGSGAMALRLKLSGGHYQPVDLIAWRPNAVETIVVDLNQEQYPEGAYDVVVLSRVLELIHEPTSLLAHLATLAPLMVLVYRVYDGGSDLQERRVAGWFNDFTDAQLKRTLKRCGWIVEAEDTDGKDRLFACARDE